MFELCVFRYSLLEVVVGNEGGRRMILRSTFGQAKKAMFIGFGEKRIYWLGGKREVVERGDTLLCVLLAVGVSSGWMRGFWW